ncbi:MAG: excinuclease ABC subunit UvrC [Alphaproteobacteria bacterium]|nr:excinuclease ABC subunit UvrC [Alphaproteobacteria bacterium]
MNETASTDLTTQLDRGGAVVRAAVETMPSRPGVYRMLDRKGDAVYVGKAKNLRKRVVTYAHVGKLPVRLRRMIAETQSVEVVVTHTEVEALLLESNLIKKLKPRYNVLLRDDKSFPYILLTADGEWPQVVKYRGSRSAPGEYFGPFASAGAVNRTLASLQRAFLLRSCSDSVFKSRSRPCLLYQIKRCAAPCVGHISEPEYAALVEEARQFLSGRSQQIQRKLATRMEAASAELRYEAAAAYRDRIRALTQIQAKQDINLAGVGDADVIAIHQTGGRTCIQVFFFRAGRNYGNRAYFPRHDPDELVDRVLAAFLGQFYDNKPVPRTVLLSLVPTELTLIEKALRAHSGHAVDIRTPQRGAKRKLVDHALANAEEALARHLAEKSSQQRLLDGVTEVFGLDGRPQRIEIYDNSHVGGTHAVGGMVVAGPDGFIKNAYRKFNIKSAARDGGPGTIAPGDDYGMMREVLRRRFARALKEDPERSAEHWPDLVLIDGGRGQLNAALAVLADLGIEDLALVAIAKGADRDAGRESFHMPDRRSFSLPPKDPVLYFLQRLRDEAHRFAIGSHRGRRSKAIGTSILDQVDGIGARRKRALLNHFGSAAGVAKAGLGDLEAVAGISKSVAKKVYDHFHADG